MFIANYTPDDILWTHGGLSNTIESDQVVEMDDARGNHILNQFGPRGLIKLQYGDEEEVRKKEAMTIYTMFWERQITNFNQQNEARKNENKAYIAPNKQLQEKADEMGLEIVGPWKLKIPVASAEMDKLKAENKELYTKIDTLQTQVSELIEAITQDRATMATDKEQYLRQFKTRSKANYKAWVGSHIEDIASWPKDIQAEAENKWKGFGYEEPWPVD